MEVFHVLGFEPGLSEANLYVLDFIGLEQRLLFHLLFLGGHKLGDNGLRGLRKVYDQVLLIKWNLLNILPKRSRHHPHIHHRPAKMFHLLFGLFLFLLGWVQEISQRGRVTEGGEVG